MKAIQFILSVLLLVLLSCNKKFKHTISTAGTIPAVCELCEYANQISGQYRGHASSFVYQWQDSLTVSLEHIFLNLGPQTDSTTMYFRRVLDFDTRPTGIDTVRIDNSSGNFAPVEMWIYSDSMIIRPTVYDHYYGALPIMEFKGKKIP